MVDFRLGFDLQLSGAPVGTRKIPRAQQITPPQRYGELPRMKPRSSILLRRTALSLAMLSLFASPAHSQSSATAQEPAAADKPVDKSSKVERSAEQTA